MGFAGDVYLMTGFDATKPVEVVVTRDAALAPAGKAVAAFMEATMVMLSPLLGAAAAEEIVGLRALAALGAPIETPGLRLTSFTQAEVTSGRVALPAPPQSVDEIVKSLKMTPAP